MKGVQAFRSAIVHSLSETAYEYYQDGILVVQDGHITSLGAADQILPTLPPNVSILTYPNSLILPGFIDTHIHYPQTEMIASYGTQLLDWLNTYTFPTERKFSDHTKARSVADFFLQELLRNGTTTALVFCAVFKDSATAFFEAAETLNLRMIAGKVMMDCNAPEYLLDTPESAYTETRELVEKWHGRGRLLYAVTPRFALTCSSAELSKAAQLLREFDGLYLHTHLSENLQEVEVAKQLYPQSTGYLDIYHSHHLTGARSVFAHSIHLTDSDFSLLAQTGSAISFCPTSNLFIGSGLFNYAKAASHNVRVGMGTDVGGGTSFSILRTISEAYKVLQLQGQNLHPITSLYLSTLGGAKSLYLDDKIGNFAVGKEADFVVLDLAATPLLAYRLQGSNSIEDKLFAIFTLGDDRVVRETYSNGTRVHQRTSSS